MTPGIRAPFFLMLLLAIVPGEGHPVGGGAALFRWHSSPFGGFGLLVDGTTRAISADNLWLSCPFPVTRSGSVAVESTVIFREGAVSASEVKSQLLQHEKEAGDYNLAISKVNVNEMQFPPSAQSWPGVPGWGIALLVLVCILVALAIIYLIALAVCQCRRKNYGHLDIFPTQDTYHPMSEYPTYHTHGRYVPPGSTKRNPYEEVSAGNGGSSLSYSNPAVATTSANL
uniref:Mucin-1 n=1 Tax=Peromyscus maniculatus bairdii TaxID=230844 RepID=A0A8C8U4F5_PERMB